MGVLTTQTISDSLYETKKAAAIEKTPIATQVPIGALQVNPDNTISVTRPDGTVRNYPVTESAMIDFCHRFRIPKAFAKRLDKEFEEGALARLINMIKTTRKVGNVTLLVNPKIGKIDRVLASDRAMISNSAFLDFVEPIIKSHDLDITHFGVDPFGGVQLNCLSTDKMFNIPGMDREQFFTGVNFANSPANGLEVKSVIQRTLCTNSTIFADAFRLHSLNEKWQKEFTDHMLKLRSQGFRPTEIEDRIRKAATTQASVLEMQKVMGNIQYAAKDTSQEFLQRYCPLDRVQRAYERKGVSLGELNNKQLSNCKSGISIWDLVNGMTNFASNDTRSNMDDWKRQTLMNHAGNLLYKKQFDTENLIMVDPFRGSDLLSEREGEILRGEI